MLGDRKYIAIGIFEPRDLVAGRCGPDPEFILLEEPESLATDAFFLEALSGLPDVYDFPS